MVVSKKELKKISRDFRMYSSRLLNTKYGNEIVDLNKFLNFIENEPLIFEFIERNNNETFDIENIIRRKDYHDKYPIPVENDREIAFVYQLLKYAQNKRRDFYSLSFGYGSGNKIQNHIEAFNNEVIKPFIDHIRSHLENIFIEIEDLDDIESNTKRIFISYSWANKDIADMIDEKFSKMGIKLTKDERDLKFKESIKEFMQSIGKHDYVIMLISDSYLKSSNCMYEVMEVMRDRQYKDRILFILLRDEDKKYYKDYESRMKNDEEFKNLKIGTNIYSPLGRIEYVKYWERKQEELENEIKKIKDDINKIQYLQELKRIRSILENINDFMDLLSDLKSETLDSLIKSDFKVFFDEVAATNL